MGRWTTHPKLVEWCAPFLCAARGKKLRRELEAFGKCPPPLQNKRWSLVQSTKKREHKNFYFAVIPKYDSKVRVSLVGRGTVVNGNYERVF